MLAYGGFWNGFHGWWLIPIIIMIMCFILMRGYTSLGFFLHP